MRAGLPAKVVRTHRHPAAKHIHHLQQPQPSRLTDELRHLAPCGLLAFMGKSKPEEEVCRLMPKSADASMRG